jgi:hypothetical protein
MELKRDNAVLRDQMEMLRQTASDEIEFVKAKNRILEESNSRILSEFSKSNKKLELELGKIRVAVENESKRAQLVRLNFISIGYVNYFG